MDPMLEKRSVFRKRYRKSRSVPECGGKRSATPLPPKPPTTESRKPLRYAQYPSGEHLPAGITSRPHESGVADARALPSHLCHRTPGRWRDIRSLSPSLVYYRYIALVAPRALLLPAMSLVFSFGHW